MHSNPVSPPPTDVSKFDLPGELGHARLNPAARVNIRAWGAQIEPIFSFCPLGSMKVQFTTVAPDEPGPDLKMRASDFDVWLLL